MIANTSRKTSCPTTLLQLLFAILSFHLMAYNVSANTITVKLDNSSKEPVIENYKIPPWSTVGIPIPGVLKPGCTNLPTIKNNKISLTVTQADDEEQLQINIDMSFFKRGELAGTIEIIKGLNNDNNCFIETWKEIAIQALTEAWPKNYKEWLKTEYGLTNAGSLSYIDAKPGMSFCIDSSVWNWKKTGNSSYLSNALEKFYAERDAEKKSKNISMFIQALVKFSYTGSLDPELLKTPLTSKGDQLLKDEEINKITIFLNRWRDFGEIKDIKNAVDILFKKPVAGADHETILKELALGVETILSAQIDNYLTKGPKVCYPISYFNYLKSDGSKIEYTGLSPFLDLMEFYIPNMGKKTVPLATPGHLRYGGPSGGNPLFLRVFYPSEPTSEGNVINEPTLVAAKSSGDLTNFTECAVGKTSISDICNNCSNDSTRLKCFITKEQSIYTLMMDITVNDHPMQVEVGTSILQLLMSKRDLGLDPLIRLRSQYTSENDKLDLSNLIDSKLRAQTKSLKVLRNIDGDYLPITFKNIDEKILALPLKQGDKIKW